MSMSLAQALQNRIPNAGGLSPDMLNALRGNSPNFPNNLPGQAIGAGGRGNFNLAALSGNGPGGLGGDGNQDDMRATLARYLSQTSNGIASSLGVDPSNVPDLGSQVATVDTVFQIIRGFTGLRLPMPLRSTTAAMSSASNSLSLTGNYLETAVAVIWSRWSGPVTVQVAAQSFAYDTTFLVDGNAVLSGNIIGPIPALSTDRSVTIGAVLGIAGTTLTGTLASSFVAADTGQYVLSVFVDMPTAMAFLTLGKG